MTLLQQQIRFQTQITHRFNKWDRKRREREREVRVFEKRERMSRPRRLLYFAWGRVIWYVEVR